MTIGHIAPDGGGPCSDLDGDGFGVGVDCDGPDCDEGNPYRQDCPDCDATPIATGCPCEGGEPVSCYDGPDGSETHLPCSNGVRTCEAGVWSICREQTLPSAEVCDGNDDDCDGDVDDGLDACACGGDGEAESLALGVGGTPWSLAASRGLVVEDDGALGVDGSRAELSTLWISSSAFGTVTKLDLETRAQTGRYHVGPSADLGIAALSANLRGDAAVLSYTEGARVTRVNANVDDCGPGDTSEDGDELFAWENDACVMWSVVLPVLAGGIDAGVAWENRPELDGAADYIWAAVPAEPGARIFEVEADGTLTGNEVALEAADHTGHATVLAMGPGGRLWAAANHLPEMLYEIDTAKGEVVGRFGREAKIGCMAADGDGQVWVAGSLGQSYVFDSTAGELHTIPIDGTRGVVADGHGSAWFGGIDGLAYRVDAVDRSSESHEIGIEPFSYLYLAHDGNDGLWVVERGLGIVTTFPEDDPAASEHVTDVPGLAGACGDPTGSQLQNVLREGVHSHVFEGCATTETTWTGLTYETRLAGEASIDFEIRTADTLVGLADAPFVRLGGAADGMHSVDVAAALLAADVRQGRLLELRTTLRLGADGAMPHLVVARADRCCGDVAN